MYKLGNVSADNINIAARMIKSEASHLDLSCNKNKILLSDDSRLLLGKAVEQKLQVESSDQIMETFTYEELQTAAELFLYLNSCPDIWFKFWSSFYTDLFLQPADQIILTLNRMMKGKGAKVEDGSIRAEKLMRKISSKLSLRYKEIQRTDKLENKSQTASFNISDSGSVLLFSSQLLLFLH